MKFKYIVLLFCVLLLSACSTFKNKGELVTNKNTEIEKQDLDFQYSFFEANKQKMLGNIKDATRYYLRCLSFKPKNGAANYELASLLYLGEDYAAANQYAEKAHKADPNNKWYYALYIASEKALGNYKKASRMLEQMLEKHPDDYNGYLELTDMYLYLKDDNKALQILEKFEEQHGYSEALMVEKNRIFIRKSDYDSARKETEKMIKKEPDNPDYSIILGDLYAEEGQYDEAFEIYQNILDAFPDNGKVHFSLSEYYRRKGDDERSYVELQKAFESDEIEVETKTRLLSAYFQISNPTPREQNQVYTLINILRENYPNNMQVCSLYSDMLVKDQRFKDAQVALSYMIRKATDRQVIWEQLLYVDNQLADFDSLYQHSVMMIDYFPNQSMAYFFAGLSGYQIKKYQSAVQYLESGLDFALGDTLLQAQFYTLLGDSYHRLKQHQKSDKAYENAIALQPENYFVYNNYAYYLATRKTKLQRAEDLMEICIEHHPNNGTYLDTYAWVLFQQKNYTKALTVIEKAYQSGGRNSAVIIEHYGDILFRNHQRDKAVKKWKEAKSLDENTRVELQQKIKTGKLED